MVKGGLPVIKSSVPYFSIKFNSATLSCNAASDQSVYLGVETIPIPRIPEIPSTYKQAIEVLGLDYIQYQGNVTNIVNATTHTARDVIYGFDLQQAISPSQSNIPANTLIVNATVGTYSLPLDPASPYVIKSTRRCYTSNYTNTVANTGGTTGVFSEIDQSYASGYVDLTAGGTRQGPLIIGSSLSVGYWMATGSGSSDASPTVYTQVTARCRFITVSNNEFEYELLNLLQL